MSNPVINNFGKVSGGGAHPAPSSADLQGMYDRPAYTGPTQGVRYMTLDSVVQRTGAMLLTILAVGGVTWALVPSDKYAAPLIIGALGGLALGLYMSFTTKANAVTALLYSAFEGLFLGSISHLFEQRFPGIVIQAMTGTLMVAGGMLFVYKIGAIRVTPRFTRMVVGALIGVVGLMVVNLIASLFTSDGLGLRSGGGLSIVFSLVCIAIAAFCLVLDFDMIEQGIRNGAPEKFAWYASFGLVLTLVWLYLEILRLLGYIRN